MDMVVTPPDASALMKRGIALLNESTPESLTEAVGLFDQALMIRRTTLVPGDHWLAYLTAASWMNRGDALTRLAQPAQIAAAVRSYDEALVLMREVPLEANPLYRRRLAIAWMNRGISLHQQGSVASFTAAVESFEQGIAAVSGHPEHTLLLACAWMNRGNALLHTDPMKPAEARASAVNALALLAESESQDLLAGETALKARYVICQAIAEQLTEPLPADAVLELTAAATDAVEDGLHLARHWEMQGEKCFRSLAADFFRFGLTAYRMHQPHFLAEFITENLDPRQPQASFAEDETMHCLAVDALSAVARDLQAEGFAAIHTPRFASLLEILRVLQFTEDRLVALGNFQRDTI